MTSKRSHSVHRSGLTMPINNPRFVDKAWTRGCDSINLDFEDSVPQSQKPHARTLARDAIASVNRGGAEVTIRINEGYIEADVTAALWPGLGGLNMGHTRSAEEVRLMDRCMTELERRRGIRPGTVVLGVAIDTTLATVRSETIATASPRIQAFSGGGGYDYSLDMGVEMFVGFDQFFYPRNETSLIARALGLRHAVHAQLPDTAGNVGDAERAQAQAEANRRLGGRNGHGLHPNVVEPQNRGLTPPPGEVEEAQRVLAFFQELDERGEVEGWLQPPVITSEAKSLEGGRRLIDRYEAARAQELLDWAAACAEKDAFKARMQAQAQTQESPGAG